MSESSPQRNCSLCSGELIPKFDLLVLSKYQVQYLECTQCESLQTELPYWIEESYAKGNIAHLDTGTFQRNLQNLAASFFIAKLVRSKINFDFGGGDGLLCRMLRDYGINSFVSDKYAENIYAQGFDATEGQKPDFVISFEVLEHFANPKVDLDQLFQVSPKAVLVTTGRYSAQGSDWWYLNAETGQHIFFYSNKAMKLVAKKYGYQLIMTGKFLPISGFTLFLKSRNPITKLLATILLNPVLCWFAKAVIVFFPGLGAIKDRNRLIATK